MVDIKVHQFHSQLKDCFWLQGEPGQKNLILQPGKSRLFGVVSRQVNLLSASIDSVLNFLASQFEAGLEYHTLNVYHHIHGMLAQLRVIWKVWVLMSNCH